MEELLIEGNYAAIFGPFSPALTLWENDAQLARLKNDYSIKTRLIDKRWKRIAWVVSSFLLIPTTIMILDLAIKAPFEVISGLKRFITGRNNGQTHGL